MRKKNPLYMQEIVDYADQYFQANHKSPSCREIAAHTSLSRNSVHNYLVAMNESGRIGYDGQTILTPNIRAMMDGSSRRIGIVGSVSCGLPADANAIQEEYMSLPASMVGKEEVYLLYATGDSMIEAGICHGDMVLVRRQETAKDGDIVVAWVEGEGNTLKRFRREGKMIILHPENSAMPDIRVKECRVQGVAVWVFKKVG